MKINIDTLVPKYNFKKLFKAKDYVYFDNGNYNLNIIGIRKNKINVTNKFDDYLVVIYKVLDKEYRKIYKITTTAGLYYMGNKMGNSNGTAILVPNQYRSSWTIGLHKGQYEALVQCKPVKVYRDSDKDNQYDFNAETIDNGMFGINIHKAGRDSTLVNNWSAGCQVFKRAADFNEFMDICHKQVYYKKGNKFTYTLLNENDL